MAPAPSPTFHEGIWKMKPGVFSLDNAIAMLPDDERRRLTAEARGYAEEGLPPREDFGPNGTPWEHVWSEHKRIIWRDAYSKRRARLKRLAAALTDIVRTSDK